MTMRNRDLPASGIPDSEFNRGPDSIHMPGAIGLTKREFAAIHIMAGLVSSESALRAAHAVARDKRLTVEVSTAREVIAYTDALFDELERGDGEA